MRAQTQRRIDALHAEIERLVAMEKAWFRRTNSELNSLHLNIEDARIDMAAFSPKHRAEMRIATASLPVAGVDR